MHPFYNLKPFPCEKLYPRFLDAYHLRLFLKNYLPKEIVKELDMEGRLDWPSTDCINGICNEPFSGRIFGVPLKNKKSTAYFILDFRDFIDYEMAINFTIYQARFVQFLNQYTKFQRGNKVPHIYSVLLYSGKEKWDAPLDASELFEKDSKDDLTYVSHQPFLIVEVAQLKKEIEKHDDLLSTLFKIENSDTWEEAYELFLKIDNQLYEEKDDWLGRPLYIHHQRIQSRKEGLEAGFLKGTTLAILKLLKARFGDVSKELAPYIHEIDDEDQLDELLIAAHQVHSLDDFKKFLN